MTARMRRIASDWEQVKKDFSGHKNIIVNAVGNEPPEKYNVTYFVNGIYLLPDGRIETLGRHEVEINLHADYPRYKPICKIKTPIWHPNFRDGQICIGDVWGAGESLSDIIIHIGDMIQYKSWNSSSPLSSEAAQWAIENKHIFPVGTIDLYKADYTASTQHVEIDLFDSDGNGLKEESAPESESVEVSPPSEVIDTVPSKLENDFEITADELNGIEFVPTTQRMQTVSNGGLVKGNNINFKTILVKGIIWALIGAILGFALSESLSNATDNTNVLRWMGYDDVAAFFEKYSSLTSESDINDISELNDLINAISLSEDETLSVLSKATRISMGIFSALIAFGLGLFLGIGEGVYYGSKEQAFKYALIGAGISLLIGFISGYLAQTLYSIMLTDNASDFANAMVRGIGWSIMGLGVGLSIGLIKPEGRRILFCSIGGLAGAFIGGFLFNYINNAINFGVNDTGTVSRGIGIVIMGLLIGLGIGLLEQFAKSAWLKVIRGEFEGKEYLVFSGTTSIGNNGQNTIVLFKDKLVGSNHCDIVLEGSKYVLVDKGTPMGTVVNGMKITRYVLKQGDAIAIGNSVLVFNMR